VFLFKFNLALGICKLLNPITLLRLQYVSFIALITCLTYFESNIWSTRLLSAQEINVRSSLTHLLFRAIKSNDINGVRTAIEAGADLSRINLDGHTAIDVAIQYNYFEIAEYLVFARRVEQKSTLKLILPISSIRQDSAEAAPTVNFSHSKKLARVKQKNIQTLPAKTIRKEFEAPQQTTLKQTNKAQNNFSITKETFVEKAKGAVIPPQPIFIIGRDGKFSPASAEDIERIKKTANLHASRSLSDIEPRKPFFIPKPRNKPSLRLSATNEIQLTTPHSKGKQASESTPPTSDAPKLEKFETKSPNTENKPSLQKKVINAPQNDFARPTRRISPQLLKKLRESLEKSKNQKQINKKMREKDKMINLKNSDLSAPTLLRKRQSTASTGLTIDQSKFIKVVPRIVNQTKPELNKVKEKSTFSKMMGRITSLFGITKMTKTKKKENEIAESKVEIVTKTKNTQLPRIEQKYKKYHRQISTNPSTIIAKDRPSITTKKNTEPDIKQFNRQMTKIRDSSLRHPQQNKSDYQNIKKERSNMPKLDANNFLPQKKALTIPLTRLRQPLKNKLLALGNTITTGQAKLPRGIAEPDPCIRKRRGKISFCIVPVDWPHTFESIFAVNTSLYQGTRAIARYDGDKASHFHALYRSKNHAKIIEFFKKRYGNPTDVWKRIIAPFGKPRRANPTFVWRSHDPKLNKVTILEVRKFDDTRTVFPDTEHGAIRLYTAGGPPVFPIITAHDIMSIDWVARSDHLDSASPTLARTIRVLQ